MADPATLALVSLGASGASSSLGFFGALSEGKAKSNMYSYQAGVAQMNEKIALENRDYALYAGEKEAVRYGMKASQRAGAIRAGQGASGVRVDTGSAADVAESDAKIASMDLATIRQNAARTAYGYSVEATNERAKSGLYSMAASEAKRGGKMKAVASLISGVSSVSSKWMQGNQAGLFAQSRPTPISSATYFED